MQFLLSRLDQNLRVSHTPYRAYGCLCHVPWHEWKSRRHHEYRFPLCQYRLPLLTGDAVEGNKNSFCVPCCHWDQRKIQFPQSRQCLCFPFPANPWESLPKERFCAWEPAQKSGFCVRAASLCLWFCVLPEYRYCTDFWPEIPLPHLQFPAFPWCCRFADENRAVPASFSARKNNAVHWTEYPPLKKTGAESPDTWDRNAAPIPCPQGFFPCPARCARCRVLIAWFPLDKNFGIWQVRKWQDKKNPRTVFLRSAESSQPSDLPETGAKSSGQRPRVFHKKWTHTPVSRLSQVPASARKNPDVCWGSCRSDTILQRDGYGHLPADWRSAQPKERKPFSEKLPEIPIPRRADPLWENFPVFPHRYSCRNGKRRAGFLTEKIQIRLCLSPASGEPQCGFVCICSVSPDDDAAYGK